jgi:multiple sugar transport system ATP-binding protein
VADVQLIGVTKRFGKVTAVSDLTLDIGDGEFVILLGPTGAGKTTTLRLAAGLERADDGRVRIGGRDVTSIAPAERDVAFVFQQFSLYPHLSVFDNLAFPLRSPARRMSSGEIRSRVNEVAELLHIVPKLANMATALSGGEMQRVAIGRALVRRPAIYLMDEPLSSLDAKLRSELRLELKRIQADLGSTVLFVTHDQIEALTMADRIGVLDHGRLVQLGSPRRIYEDPDSIYVAAGSPPAGARIVGLRTENIRIERTNGSGATGKVEWVEHLGDQNHLHLSVGQQRIVTLASPDSDFGPGDLVRLSVVRPLYFDAAGNRLRG